MSNFNVSNMPYNTVLYLHSEKDAFELDPEYQRESDIWPLEKRQLLIDSIINGYDIPKIYFHKFSKPKRVGGHSKTHAIIDGKQRLTSIWSFIDGEFPLSEDIEFISDDAVDLRGLTYRELGKRYPKLKLRFDSFPLTVVEVDTPDVDLIEDMFSRLNEAVPLSAAEKRNAFGGPMPKVIRRVAKTSFFTQNLPFPNKRYRHFDLAAKFLLIERQDKVADTKKIYLDEFVRESKARSQSKADAIGRQSTRVLKQMSLVFTASDQLLRSVGTTVLYYHVFRLAMREAWVGQIERKEFEEFELARQENRSLAEKDIRKATYDLLEFDRYVQTPNDGYAISARLKILLHSVFEREMPDDYYV